MIRIFLDAFSKNIYKTHSFEKNEDGRTIIIYGHRNKRLATEFRKLASDIVSA